MESDLGNTLFKNNLKPMGGGEKSSDSSPHHSSHEYTHAVRLLTICGLRIVTCFILPVARLHLLSPFHYFPATKIAVYPLTACLVYARRQYFACQHPF